MSDAAITIFGLVMLLGTLVFFHELGHFAMAKLLRIRVEEFAFGFGPKLIRLFKRGDTEYTIHPVPLGGFVKLSGMEPGEEHVPNGFQSKPVWGRLLVYFAGPAMSFVLAYLIFSTLGLTLGLPGRESLNRVDIVLPGSRAEWAGLKSGDEIIKINSRPIRSGREMLKVIHGSANKPLKISISRNGRIIETWAKPAPGKIRGKRVGLLGFTAVPKLERVGLLTSIRFGNSATYEFVAATLRALFSRDVKEAVGGPIAIADATMNSMKGGPYPFIRLVGILSLSLGVVNLLPIPILDGGGIMLLIIEALKRRRLSPHTWEVAQKVGLTVIAVLFVLIMFKDLNNLAADKLFR